MPDTILDIARAGAGPRSRGVDAPARTVVSADGLRGARRRRRRADRARAAVILGGVPEPVVARAERRGAVDWRLLAGEIDGLSIATGGQHGVRAFWLTPHRELAGRTPLQALDGPVAAQRLADLARDRAAAITRSRFGEHR